LKTLIIRVDKQERLDKIISEKIQESRNQVENLINNQNVFLNGKLILKRGFKVKFGDEVTINLPHHQVKEKTKFPINFDIPIIYEDESLLILNKPAGVVIHSAPSVKEATLVDWLKEKNYSLSNLNGEERHGIVHRLDKWTTGAIVVAKDNKTHLKLSEQLQNRTMGRFYLSIINQPLKQNIIIEQPIGRNFNNRLKMGIVSNGRYAKTEFRKIKISTNQQEELLLCKLYTGRTHQIRVHLNYLNRYILGDNLYFFKSKKDNIKSIFLHAYILYLIHPISGKKLQVEAPLYNPIKEYLLSNFEMELRYEEIRKIYNF
jgi:23S rRNA pseudouridine1911/1915/1917 synthase